MSRRSNGIYGSVAALLWAAAAVPAPSSLAAEPPAILLVVPQGSEVARIEAARAAVSASRALLIVGAAERVPLREGVELVADRTFSDAPPSDLVVVLPGEAPGLEEFLAARRRTARVILLLGESPLARRLKGGESRGALILVGGPEAVRALTGVESPAASSSPGEAPRAAPPPPAPPSPREASPTPAGGAVSRYFSAPRPTPTPKP